MVDVSLDLLSRFWPVLLFGGCLAILLLAPLLPFMPSAKSLALAPSTQQWAGDFMVQADPLTGCQYLVKPGTIFSAAARHHPAGRLT